MADRISVPSKKRRAKKKTGQKRRQQQASQRVAGGQKVKVNFPPRPWRDNNVAPADALMKLTGGHGKNVLSRAHMERQPEALAAANQDTVHDVQPSIPSSALVILAVGIVLAAKKRGWNSQNSAASQFQVLGYLVDIFRASLKGATLTFTSAPRWFVELCVALRPKRHAYIVSEAYYEPVVIETALGVTSTMIMGSAQEAYALVFGEASGSPINGYRTLTPAPVYDPVVGASEFSSMWNVFPGRDLVGTPTELISPTQPSYFMAKDCSAFAMVKSALATGYFNPGGVNQMLENEVHIDSPLLAKFCGDNTIIDLVVAQYRRGFQYASTGGTSCAIGPRCLEFTHIDQFRKKGRAVFKFYNFDEYFEVFSLIIGGVLERCAGQTTITPKPYPLTALQTQVMLRQALIPFFNNEMAADLRMKEADGQAAGIQVLLPFSVADNGCSQTALSAGPEVPRFFAEMVKGARRLTADVSRGKTGRITMDWIPILSRPPSWGQGVNYTYGTGENVNLVYLVPPVAEVPMNLVDCSVVSGNQTLYLNLNGTELTTVIGLHNEWMAYHQPFMTGLTKLTSSAGSPLFSSVIQTRIVRAVQPIPPPEVQETTSVKGQVQPSSSLSGPKMVKRDSKSQMKGYSVAGKRIRQVNPVPGETGQFLVAGAEILNTNVPVDAELEKYRTIIVSPVVTTNDRNFSADSGYLRALYGEGISIPYTNSKDESFGGNDALNIPTLYTLHQQAADLDLKNISNSARSEIEVLLDSLDEQGHGGFLAGLGKALAAGAKVAAWAGGMTGF
jgi:hypothetical protein